MKKRNSSNNKSSKKISIVIPTFNEEGNIYRLVERVEKVLLDSKFNYELIFVDDGSTDNTLETIITLSKVNKRVKFISFSKNFGHQRALKAGLDHANGDAVISLDADLQHPPELIPEFLNHWEMGFDVVFSIRKDTKQISFFKRMTARIFYKLLNLLSGLNLSQGAADFRLLDKKVVRVIRDFKEADLFIRGLIPWVGFKQIGIEYMPENRIWGMSKYSFKKMFSFALQGITSFSVKPLYLSTILGLVVFSFSFIYIVYALLIFFFFDKAIPGWTSLLISTLFLGSINLLMLGILGEYIGKILIESKGRPAYIIKDTNHF